MQLGVMAAYPEGEGRWTIQAAIDEGAPVPALRVGFGGHVEKPLP